MESATAPPRDARDSPLFPDASAHPPASISQRALFRATLQEWNDRYGWWLVAVAAVTAVAVIVEALAGMPTEVLLWTTAPLALLVGIAAFMASSRAHRMFWSQYAATRGLQLHEGGPVPANVPLLQRGDARKVERVLSGRIGNAEADLVQYTYVEVSTDSEGKRTSTDYDYTLLVFHLPAAVGARYYGIYCRPKGLSLGGLQDKLAHDRAVELESAGFHDRYSLRCVDEQDDIALYELFSTPFIEALTNEYEACWEQRAQDLVLFQRGHRPNSAELDALCAAGLRVYTRYCEEHT